MTTFTRIAEGEPPAINVDVNRRLSKIGTFLPVAIPDRVAPELTHGCPIDPNIYGGFTE